MKTIKKIITSAVFILAIGTLTAQTLPPQPNGGQTPTEGGNTPVGGGAPLAGGVGILLTLAVGRALLKGRTFYLQNRNVS